jgi:membrane-associated phospholipid phosphatase
VLGALATVGAVLIAAARVAAHVHHVQDVVAGLTIGAAAGVLAVWIVDRTLAVRARRQVSRPVPSGAEQRTGTPQFGAGGCPP